MSEQPAPDADICSVRVRISGRVQGVAYRWSTRDRANELGIVGWVKNLPDGDVEAEFTGSREAVDRMVAWCHDGPPLARVLRVEAEAVPPPRSAPTGFRIDH